MDAYLDEGGPKRKGWPPLPKQQLYSYYWSNTDKQGSNMKGEMDTVDDEEEKKRKGIPQGSSPDSLLAELHQHIKV